MGGRADALVAFADVLDELTESAPELRISGLARRLRSPVRVAITGRGGVGRRTVSAALRRNGVVIAPDPARADVRVVVIAETVKPEDEVMLVTDSPTLIVLNKADLAGSARGGTMANAYRCANEIHRRTGVTTMVMVGLLAMAADENLDAQLVGALGTMVSLPADLTSVDAFVTAEHVVGAAVRERLLAGLDRFGIAIAVVALAKGAKPDALPTLFREASNVDGVVAALSRVAAPVRYGRLRRVMTELAAVAVQSDDSRLAAVLASDAAALSVMTAAVEVVEAAGMEVDVGADAAAHLRRAVRWRRYGTGPVNALHRNCSADIVRGSLRLLDGSSR